MDPITKLNVYQEAAWDLVLPQCSNPVYLALGLGEQGEIQGKVKKVLRGDFGEIGLPRQAFESPEFRFHAKKELGDLLFYVATLAKVLDFSLSDIATANIDKLYDRRDRGVLQGSGDDR